MMCKSNFLVCPADDPGPDYKPVTDRFIKRFRRDANEDVINWLNENHNTKQYNTMGKFIIIFFEESGDTNGLNPNCLLYSKSVGGIIVSKLATFETVEAAKEILKDHFPGQRAQIVPILTNTEEEIYV